jgi:hypothetical protein
MCGGSLVNCARCDYDGTDFVAHAKTSGHPLCAVCVRRSLTRTELRTCSRCVATMHRNLAEIAVLYRRLPDELGRMPGGDNRSGVRTSGDVTPLPGGDVLVLLAPGSPGAAAGGQPHAHDAYPSDPPSVAYELGQWEDDFRAVRRQAAAECVATVETAVAYLSPFVDWAADNHPAIDEFAADLRRIVARLRHATNTNTTPETGAPCFEPGCHAPLERHWTDTGLAEEWRCPRCHRDYDTASYYLAVRAHLEEQQSA